MLEFINISFPYEARNIGLKISGGADSALVAYALARLSSLLKIKIYPIVITIEKKPFQKKAVQEIINFIERETHFRFNNSYESSVKDEYLLIGKMREMESLLLSSQKVDLIVSGAIHYPKGEDFSPPEGSGPDENRVGPFPLHWKGPYYTPFINYDKKQIAEYYIEYNLMNSLFPKTITCNKITSTGENHCGLCWSCTERLYGFGKI